MNGHMTIRPMETRDVREVTRIHLAAFPGFFLSFLGSRFLGLFYGEAVRCGEIALTATMDRRVVGLAMGSVRPGPFFKALLRRRFVAFALAAAPAVLRRPSVALRVGRALLKPRDAHKAPGTATLMSLAVDPAVQGTGAGKMLVGAFLEEARARGAAVVDLTTDKFGNERTNAFYQALGFRLAREIETPEGRILNEYEIALPSR